MKTTNHYLNPHRTNNYWFCTKSRNFTYLPLGLQRSLWEIGPNISDYIKQELGISQSAL